VAILYAFFMFSNLFSAAAVRPLGARRAMIASSLTYALYVSANILYTWWAMYPAAALIGVGAGWLWNGNGVFVTRHAEAYEAKLGLARGSAVPSMFGLFFGFFLCSAMLGNLLVALLFHLELRESLIFSITAAIGVLGCATVALTRDASLPPQAGAAPQKRHALPVLELQRIASSPVAASEQPSAPRAAASSAPAQRFTPWETFSMLRERDMPALALLAVYSGVSMGFQSGKIPAAITPNTLKFLVLAVAGTVGSLTSFAVGRLAGRFGLSRLFVVPLLSQLPVCALFLLVSPRDIARSLFFAAASAFALGDAVVVTVANALLGQRFGARAEPAFACYRFFQAGTAAVAFLFAPDLSPRFSAIIVAPALVIVCAVMWATVL
jgi:MFS family permease